MADICQAESFRQQALYLSEQWNTRQAFAFSYWLSGIESLNFTAAAASIIAVQDYFKSCHRKDSGQNFRQQERDPAESRQRLSGLTGQALDQSSAVWQETGWQKDSAFRSVLCFEDGFTGFDFTGFKHFKRLAVCDDHRRFG